jgi:hypothetical protein
LDRAGWGLVPHQQRPNMLLLIPSHHTTLSTLIFCLIRSQKANSYPFNAEYLHFASGSESLRLGEKKLTVRRFNETANPVSPP